MTVHIINQKDKLFKLKFKQYQTQSDFIFKQIILMLQTQFSRLQNITSQSSYRYNTIYLNEQHVAHFKQRRQQIYNEFDLVDFQKKGYLFRGQIQNYLQKKYQWVNKKLLDEMFNTMDWKKKEAGGNMYVTRQQFCQKYLKRQKQLFYEFNKLDSQQQWFNSLYNIYQKTLYLKPQYYMSVQISQMSLYKCKQDFVDIDIRYQNHQEKIEFDINEKSYDITKPSFQLILPAQQNEFFLSYKLLNTKNHDISYGNTYIQIDLTQGVRQEYYLNLDIQKNGEIVGHCKVQVKVQTRSQNIRDKLREKSQKIKDNQKQPKGTDLNFTLSQMKTKQYQYIQFLWGIKHLPAQKIQQQDVILIVVIRTLLIIGLGGFGVIIHVLGRSQPLCIICMFLMLKWRTYVILKVQVFIMTWLIVAAILLDGVWLVFSSHHISQINYLNLSSAMFFTYFLLGVKALFLVYLLVVEKPFKTVASQQRQEISVQ